MTGDQIIIRVAISRPLDQYFDYLVPRDLPAPVAGSRVLVPFSNRELTGLVVEVGVNSDFDKLKSIVGVLDEKPLLSSELLELLTWSASYYHHPPGEVLFAGVPNYFRKGKQLKQPMVWKVVSDADHSTAGDILKRAPLQLSLLNQLQQVPFLGESFLQSRYDGKWRRPMQALAKRGWVETVALEEQAPAIRSKHAESNNASAALELSDEQQDCLRNIREWNQSSGKHKPILLQGVTGSGKTEVYLRTIQPLLSAGKQVLVMVPEIGLTPQLMSRFSEFFPAYTIVTMHSGLTDVQRAQSWWSARSGLAQIIIGTRSAVFCALKAPGMIIIDEEHDGSLKQQEGFAYHARDLAIKRAADLNIPILMGSATPSLESLLNVERGRYHHLQLTRRPGRRQQPRTVLIDMSGQQQVAGISLELLDRTRAELDAGSQTMLFLNRRGFAPVLHCKQCGWHAVCPACEKLMTYHASRQQVICHHCEHQQSVSIHCPSCKKRSLQTQGQGTERLEQQLISHFPDYPVIRVDRDSVSRKGALDKKLSYIRNGEPAILVGTQMLTKGHDFPNLTLVGVIDVDQALFSPDYRALEQLAQQIVQVSGRAGRAEKPGTVILQTSWPDHSLLRTLLSEGYPAIAQDILKERRNWHYPPYGYQALVRANAPTFESGLHFLRALCEDLKHLSEVASGEVRLLGPVASPLEKRANRYRYQLLINASRRSALHAFLAQLRPIMRGKRKVSGLRTSLDVDPTNFS